MAWFLNKKTGVTWEVSNEDHIKRCTNDENYEEVDAPKENKRAKKTETGE